MNNGLNGFHRKVSEAGKIVPGLELAQSLNTVGFKGAVNSPLLSTRLGELYPSIETVEHATPFYALSMIWTGSVWAILGETQFSTSADLVTWSTPVTLPACGTGNVWSTLGWNGSQYVAVSQSGSGYSSGDGYMYTAYSSTGASWSSGTTFYYYVGYIYSRSNAGVSWVGAAWMIAHSTGTYRSTDGVNWTKIDSSLASNGFGANAIASNGAGIVMQSCNSGILLSTDYGATWDIKNPQLNSFLITYEDGFFVAGYAYYSTDGITWTAAKNKPFQCLARLTSTPNHHVGFLQGRLFVYSNKIFTSTYYEDNGNLQSPSSPPLYDLQTINQYNARVFGNNMLVAYPGEVNLDPQYLNTVFSNYVAVVTINNTSAALTSNKPQQYLKTR